MPTSDCGSRPEGAMMRAKAEEIFQRMVRLEWSPSSRYSENIQPSQGWRDTHGYNKASLSVEIMDKSTASTLAVETCDVLDGDWITFASWTGALTSEMASQYFYVNRAVGRDETARLRRYVRWRWSGLSGSDQYVAFRMKLTLRP